MSHEQGTYFFVDRDNWHLFEQFRDMRPLFGNPYVRHQDGDLFFLYPIKLTEVPDLSGYIRVNRSRPSESDVIFGKLNQELFGYEVICLGKDNGNVEDAIKKLETFLDGAQVNAVVSEAVNQSVPVFAQDFTQITDQEFDQIKSETDILLGDLDILPHNHYERQRERIEYGIDRSSFIKWQIKTGGKSVLRRIELINRLALKNAHREAVQALEGISPDLAHF